MSKITIKKGPDNKHSKGECDGVAKCVCQGEMKLAWEVGCTYVVEGAIPDNPIPPSKRGKGLMAQKQALVYVKMESTTVHKVYDFEGSLVKTITVNSAPEYHLVDRSSGQTQRDCHVSWVEYVPYFKCKLVSKESITLSLWSPILPGAMAPFTPEPPTPTYRQGTGTRSTTDSNGNPIPNESGSSVTNLPELPGMADWAQFKGFSGSDSIDHDPEHCILSPFYVIDYVGGFGLIALRIQVDRVPVATALAAVGRRLTSEGISVLAAVNGAVGMLPVSGGDTSFLGSVEGVATAMETVDGLSRADGAALERIIESGAGTSANGDGTAT